MLRGAAVRYISAPVEAIERGASPMTFPFAMRARTSGLAALGLAALALSVISVGMPRVAAAQGAAQQAPTGDASSEYRQLIKQALDEFQRGNWDEAAGLFAQAHRVSPSARTLRGMGLSAFEGRRYVDSLEQLRAALLSEVNPLTPAQRQEVADTVARAEHYVAKLQLTVTPQSAEVFVNGEAVPNNGGERLILLDPGLVEIRAVSPGHQLELRQLRMISGANQHIELRLAPTSGEPLTPTAADASAHTSTSANKGSFPYTTFGWLSVGLAAGATVGAVVAWRVREGAAQDFNDSNCTDSSPLSEENAAACDGAITRVGSAETAIAVTAVAAGALLGVGVLFFVLDAVNDNDTATARTCSGGPGELGVQCTFAF